ncbi:hypothetical protein CLTHE_10190 [Clostridium thermobutyricum DSM 4928]|uniref:Uncharacterized protein n=1 Tax=Clostridium thermobutyricum DSM 4928 TaxID=1121339 RepID=A0A1V4SYK9_9CLOT|nr:hypothetical protein CLTHE_10190 [Clostridium thermobutyricum DSM 4928]
MDIVKCFYLENRSVIGGTNKDDNNNGSKDRNTKYK